MTRQRLPREVLEPESHNLEIFREVNLVSMLCYSFGSRSDEWDGGITQQIQYHPLRGEISAANHAMIISGTTGSKQ